jgi:hypothetical protein
MLYTMTNSPTGLLAGPRVATRSANFCSEFFCEFLFLVILYHSYHSESHDFLHSDSLMSEIWFALTFGVRFVCRAVFHGGSIWFSKISLGRATLRPAGG